VNETSIGECWASGLKVQVCSLSYNCWRPPGADRISLRRPEWTIAWLCRRCYKYRPGLNFLLTLSSYKTASNIDKMQEKMHFVHTTKRVYIF